MVSIFISKLSVASGKEGTARSMLAMTTSVFVADRQICLEAGINKHTAKPMTPASNTPAC